MNVVPTKKIVMKQTITSNVTGSLVAVAFLLALISDAQAADKPNVIVILADDLGYGDLSCYGADDIATLNIDQMATEGAKFTSFYVSPVCSATRAALMTGSHPRHLGQGTLQQNGD